MSDEPLPLAPFHPRFGERVRVAVLISGRGSNMARLIEAAQAPDYPGQIVLVVANRPHAAGLVTAAAAGIDTLAIDSRPQKHDREAYDRALDATLRAADVDIVCLAGFMRLMSPWFCETWAGRLINIHPALLPAFPGLDTHARALQAGVRWHGCTVHFVTAGMDEGPIIAQGAVPVFDGDTPESLSARVLGMEHRLYPLALRRIAEGAIQLGANGSVLGGFGLVEPFPPLSGA